MSGESVAFTAPAKFADRPHSYQGALYHILKHIDTRFESDTLVLTLAGDWTIKRPLPRFTPFYTTLEPTSEVRAIGFDTVNLGSWDSSLLVFILETLRYCQANNLHFKKETLPENILGLIMLSQAVPEAELLEKDTSKGLFKRLGEKGIAIFKDGVAFLRFTGEFMQTLVGLASRRTRLRGREFWISVQKNTSGALPIVTLISFLVGLILSFLGAVVLRRFGADYYVSHLVSYGILRELGALMTAIIMAGRTGAAIAAELGSMKISEEISALETLGVSPMEFLVLPRFLGIFVAMPMLAIYANFIGVLGGVLVALGMLDVNFTQFITGFLDPISLVDALLGLFKATVFGAIIGLSGSMRGLQTGKGAEAVGVSTTSAVVTAITNIIIANAIIDCLAAIIEI